MEVKEILKNIKSQKQRKFDESVEVVFSLASSKGAESSLRLDLNIPHQFGSQKKVLVLCDKSEAADASAADYVGLDEYVDKIKEGWKDFDVVIATPTVMPKIAILGKFLGSSGLMPNPKSGTVTKDLKSAINDFKSGKVSIKANKAGQIQLAAGKRSMDDKDLEENIDYIVKTISGSVSTPNIKSVFVKTSMGTPYRLM